MSESLASWISLSGFILSALVLFVRAPDRSGHTIMMNLLTAVLCLFGGFLIAAALIKLSGGIANPIINSVLVVVGALACVTAKEMLSTRRKTK